MANNLNNITITNGNSSKYKNIKLIDNSEYEISPVNSDLIQEYPEGKLKYLNEFQIYDDVKINNTVIETDHSVPPKPEIATEWHDEYLKIILTNYEIKYVLKVIIDGESQEYNNEYSYFIYNEGKHVIYIEYVDDSLLTMSYLLETINYKKKYQLPAPSILYDEDTNHGWIYYHPGSLLDEKNYNFYRENGIPLPANEIKLDLGEIRGTKKIEAYTVNDKAPVDPNESFINPSSNSKKVTAPNNDDSWKDLYNEYIKYNRLWNIEYFYTPEFKELYRGQEYFTLGNDITFSNNAENTSGDIELIGLSDGDVIFAGFPHVKRYPNINYYATINNDIYELGQSIDTSAVPINRDIELMVGCSYKNENGELTRKEKTVSVNLDTTFPPYPKLSQDLESVMTEPFEVDLVRENNIEYEVKLNGEIWDINKKASEKYIMEDGEYMLDMIAKKNSNNTFRCRSAYFTINTFQHVPLEPLKTKIIPLEITNSPTIGINGELVLDSNSGNYGIVYNGVIYSPTVAISTALLTIEETSNDISKMYLTYRKQLDTLLERYSINSKNMGSALSGKNGAIIKLKVLINEIENLKTRISDINNYLNELSTNEKSIFQKKEKLNSFKKEIDEFKNQINSDKEKTLKIIRYWVLQVFSDLKHAVNTNNELNTTLNDFKLMKKFELYKIEEEKRYEQLRSYLLSVNGGVSNE